MLKTFLDEQHFITLHKKYTMDDKQIWDWLKQMKNQGLSMLKISKYARLDYNKFMAQLNLHSTPEGFFTPKQKERLLEKINHIKNVCNEPL